MLDVPRKQEADLAPGMHAFDRSGNGMVALDNPWLSCNVFEPEQPKQRVLGHPKTDAHFVIVVA
jgi:hypothetical protein